MAANSQIVSFADPIFKAKLLEASDQNGIARDEDQNYIQIDTNGDGEIQISEALTVYHLFVDYSNISNLGGIENFLTLQTLVAGNNNLSAIDVSGLPNLAYLDCGVNQLTQLDVSGMAGLQNLYCHENLLVLLNVTNCAAMVHLECSNNSLTALDLSGLTNVATVLCDGNQLTTLNVSGFLQLDFLNCSSNQLTTLNITGSTAIQVLNCENNQLTTLDISEIHPEILDCSYNQLETLILKNGFDESDSFFEFFENPLEYICADSEEIESVQEDLIFHGLNNTAVNSYCTFTPGGTYYTVGGANHFDIGNDGCDAADPMFPFLKFAINGGADGTIVSDSSGTYSLALPAGNYTISPVFETSSYFTVTPPSLTVAFPTDGSPVTQDFCIVPNGTHHDLEVTIVALTPPIPGYDSDFAIVYKNKGNQMQSGSVGLQFEDASMDVTTMEPIATAQSENNVSWDFENLSPGESRVINLTFNINAPTDEPPVEIEDQFDFTAQINYADIDETPEDNIDVLNQIVVGSFDPNDIVCLEGDIVSPEIAGKYVHYLIRFENTGTGQAQNIVVRDIINAADFSIETLVPLAGSSVYETRIIGNTVEFIFEGVNLPFDDANNDGFVLFKIKTKPTLVSGDAFSNTAGIYFDYNLPVDTTPAVTLVQVLSAPDFGLNSRFTIYPVPAKNVLNIAGDGIIRGASIYNSLGQLVITAVNLNQQRLIDISGLQRGQYYLKLVSDEGNEYKSFLKQ